jgi:hypothetical protein
VGYPPGLGSHLEIDTGVATMNEGTMYANREFNAREYIYLGTLWFDEVEPAGTHVDEYFEPFKSNFTGAQVGVFNRTYGTATDWYANGYVGC